MPPAKAKPHQRPKTRSGVSVPLRVPDGTDPFADDEAPSTKHVARRRVAGYPPYLSEMRRREAAQRKAIEKDAAPRTKATPTPGPRKPSRVAKAVTSRGLHQPVRYTRSALASPAANPDKVLVLELLAAETIYIGVQVAHGDVPAPKRMAAILAVFAVLGLLSAGGQKWGRVAYSFGGLLVAGLALEPVVASRAKASNGNAAAAAATGLKAATIVAGG